MSNPWMSLWLSAANSWARTMQGWWLAELRRQQIFMTNQMMRQSADFWSKAWTPLHGQERNRRTDR